MPCKQAAIILHFNLIFFRIKSTMKKGRVYLVGAEPGDIGLLAIKGPGVSGGPGSGL
jgi:hypothetical protein